MLFSPQNLLTHMLGSLLSCPGKYTTETVGTQNHKKLPVWATWAIVSQFPFIWCLRPSGRNLGTLRSQVTIFRSVKVQSNPYTKG